MQDFRKFFKNKRVTVVGLGLLGKRLGDIAFLAECGAHVTVTDLKTVKELAPSIQKLRKYRNIKYVLDEHRFKDFENKDFILKGQGVALDSPYINHARKNGIPIEMDESLFAKLAPKVKIIGITGTRGKSTTTILIYEILKNAGMRAHLGGNIRGTAALPLLKEIKEGDIVVFELSSWQLQGFGEAKISPHISVFTNFMPDHMNYYKNNLKEYFKDKAYIYKFQNKDDILILGVGMKKLIKNTKSKKIVAKSSDVPKSWKLHLKGVHNLENISCALAVAREMGVSEKIIKNTIENFKAIPGRFELIKTIRGIDIYNDTNSTTPEATIVALNSFSKKVILIMGGMDKMLNTKNLDALLPKKTKKVFMTPGSGGDKILTRIAKQDGKNKKINIQKVVNLKEAVQEAMKYAKAGDVVLFSPAFASFNMFKNEYDRGDQFVKIVQKLR